MVGRIAVLVDAGYLLVASAELATGKLLKRHLIGLQADEVVLALIETASMAEPADELLRIYWYDATVSPDTLTDEQLEIARKRSCKLRLGTLNRYGNQKGVDTLMVLDMLALARNKAVTSLLVVSGDDDLRPAIEQAQELGVRVHLLGVRAPNGAHNQAERLQRECDSFREWVAAEVSQFIAEVEAGDQGKAPPANRRPEAVPAIYGAHEQERLPPERVKAADPLADAIEHALLDATEQELHYVMDNTDGEFIAIPQGIDRRLLGRFGGNLERTVTEDEKKVMRRALYEHVMALMQSQGAPKH
jgi:hypothetical protein